MYNDDKLLCILYDQRKNTIEDETDYCDPSILQKILEAKVGWI